MVFRTRWNPTDAANELEKVVRRNSPRNIGDEVHTNTDGHGGYNIEAESHSGYFHDSGVIIHVQPNLHGTGSVVTVEGDHKTPGSEVQDIEERLKKRYFGD